MSLKTIIIYLSITASLLFSFCKNTSNGGESPKVQQSNELTVTPTEFYGINKSNLTEIKDSDRVRKAIRKTGEGDFEVLEIVDKDNKVLGYIYDDQIEITTEQAKCPKGIGIGSTYEEVITAYPNAPAHGSEIEGRVNITAGKIMFLMTHREWSYEVSDMDGLKASKVAAIWLNLR